MTSVRRHSSFTLKASEVQQVETNFFVKWIVFHPLKVCCGCFFLTILTFMTMTAVTIDFGESRGWLIQEGDEIDLWDARQKGVEDVFSAISRPVQSQESYTALVAIYFKTDSNNVLTPANVDRIVEITHDIANETEYRQRYCWWDVQHPEEACGPTHLDTIIYEFQGKNQEQINAHLQTIGSDKYHYFGKNIETDQESNMLVSYLRVGMPFPSCDTCNTSEFYSNKDDVYEQIKPYNKWMRDVWDEYMTEDDESFQIYPMSFDFYEELTLDALNETNILLAVNIIIILCYVVFHTQSLFLGGIGLIQILLCFGPAFLVYWHILGIHIFGFLNVMIIFVIMGIGADDMFVMTDAWVQSAHLYSDDVDRMSYAFSRASKAMLITSFTTAAAFFATAISKILPIKSFAVWAGWVILFNYVYFIVMFPSLIMLQHYYKKLRCCYCSLCCPCACAKEKYCKCCHDDEEVEELELDIGSNEDINDGEHDLQQNYRCIERFFKDKFSTFIIDYKWFILALYLIVACVGIFTSTIMEPPPGLEQNFRAGTKYDNYYQLFASEVYADPIENNLEVVAFWGIEGIDRSEYGTWQSGGGDVVWDGGFDMRSAAAQQHIYDFCTALQADSNLVIPIDYNMKCFMYDFKTYVDGLGGAPFPKTYATQDELVAELNAFMEDDLGSTYDVNGQVGILDGSLKFVEITALSPISLLDNSRDEKKDSRDDFIDFLDEWNGKDVEGVSNAKMTTVLEWGWPWLETEPYFAKGALNGIAIALPLAFVVLVIFTQNLIISIYSVLAIFGVMLTITILIIIAGWDFGIIESLALVVVVGFSVDYVVHLGHAYLESTLKDRESRLTMALLTMGISVFSGAFTTALSGVPLCFSSFNFFFKMGVLIVFVCVFALSWSLLFFMALLSYAGPTGEQGDIKAMWRNLMGQKVEPEKETGSGDVEKVEPEKKAGGGDVELQRKNSNASEKV